MRMLKLIGVVAVAGAAGLAIATPADAQSGRKGVKQAAPAGVVSVAKGKRFHSARSAPRVHYSRPPRVVG